MQKYAPMLFLPALTSDDFYPVANIPKEEALDYVAAFDSLVEAKRTLKHSPTGSGELMEFYDGNLNLETLIENETLNELVEVLSVSAIKGYRGRRAVFVDVDGGVIGVGTTVVYNRNWATRGVLDTSVLVKILEAIDDTVDVRVSTAA